MISIMQNKKPLICYEMFVAMTVKERHLIDCVLSKQSMSCVTDKIDTTLERFVENAAKI